MALITTDTNILINALAGNKNAVSTLNGKECLISFIVVIELLSWKEISSQRNIVRSFLKNFIAADNEPSIQEQVIDIRLKYGLKIPDAFIAATALHYRLPLFSGDNVFKRIKELEFVYVEF